MADAHLNQACKRLEPKWQQFWIDQQTFRAANPGEPGSEKPKYYILDMFPYPSGEGLHVGHPLGYIATDILARYKRMRGFNVLHPMGWDAFGLPAEQYAIKMGVHPAITTKKNITTFKRQLTAIGLGYDWSREISTADPKYYKWTQWIFKKLFERGLVYQTEMAVNWCPALGTVLANDEVIDGKSERGGHDVVRKPMKQWVLKITAYAERLLNDLDTVDWPESTKEHQRNWIGKSEGARVKFASDTDPKSAIEVFTTRPDTLFGVNFVALAPEHPLVATLTTSGQRAEVDTYVTAAAKKSELQRTELSKTKTGVFTGAYVLHPLTQQKIPVWIADYILGNYGTGAIMGVPAHDERDAEFAGAIGLTDYQSVIDADGKMINSATANESFNALPIKEGAKRIIAALEKTQAGEKTVTYRLRDWLFARQRYWGEPVPVIHVTDGPDKGKTRLLSDSELPLELPTVERYEPTGTGESPLAAVADWVSTIDPVTGAAARRETDTMPGSAASSWYFLRYMDPHNETEPFSPTAEKYWQQVDFYMGGSEHAVGHLLYSRFWQKVLFDLGLVGHTEPFKRLFHQGMMLGEDGEKMSKSRGNVINPDQIISEYGADTLRLFEMFLGPIDKAKPWQTNSIEGVYRFLSRYWRFATSEEGGLNPAVSDLSEAELPPAFVASLHRTIKQVTDDIESLRFNTAISAMMIFTNDLSEYFNATKKIPRIAIKTLTQLIAPFAPHMSEEIWELLGQSVGRTGSIALEPWPSFDASKLVSQTFEVVVQINGKKRDSFEVGKDTTEAEMKTLVFAREHVQKWLEGKEPKKFIYVKHKLVSIVV